MNKRIMLTIAKKEFFSFINSPLSFVIIVPFLFISTFIFLRTSLVVGEASLRPFFELLPWFLILLAPALSMKLFTDEKKTGTLELLFAHPVSEFDIVFGKFFGSLAFFLVILGTTALLPISLLFVANPDPGIIISQYIGALFVGALFLSIGVFTSAYIPSAIGSFLTAAAISFGFILLGLEFVTLMFPWPFNRIVEELAVMTHVNTMARGLLDIRDMLYFATISTLFHIATVLKLSERKIQEDHTEKNKLSAALALTIGIGILLNFFMSVYPLRIDLTQQKLFTLSQGTKQTISTLPDLVTITVYASRNLPGQMQLTLKEVEDILKDYQKLGNKLTIKTVYPEADPAVSSEAKQAGIEEVTFNRIGSGSFEVQTGVLGLTIRYGDKSESIPFIQDTSDLEYQMTRRIRKLTGEKEKTIAIFSTGFAQNQTIEQLIQTQYKTANVTISDLQDTTKSRDYSMLVVLDDGTRESTASAVLKTLFEEEGKILLLSNGASTNPQSLTASPSLSSASAFLAGYGVSVKKNLVYDLRSNETLTFGNGNVRYVAPYPFWVRSLPADSGFAPLSGIKSLTLGWPSALDVTETQGVIVKKLLGTSPNANVQEGNFNIAPGQNPSLGNPGGNSIPLAALIEKGSGRIIVVGDVDFVSDQFLQNFPENTAFLTNAIDYLVSDKDLAAIPRKTESRPVFRFGSPIAPVMFQYTNMFVPSILVIAFAIYWLSRRRKLTRRVYHKNASS